MRVRKTVIYLTTLLALFTAPALVAAYGHGTGTCPLADSVDSTPVAIEGMVTAIGTPGTGMSVDTGDEVLTVYGIGPVWFWNKIGVARPEIGEQVSVSGFEVTLSDGSTRIIATEITVGDATITLRDAETGIPAWRQSCSGCTMSGSGKGMGQRSQRRDGSCMR